MNKILLFSLFFGVVVVLGEEACTSSNSNTSGGETCTTAKKNQFPCFSVHPNGDGKGDGLKGCVNEFQDFEQVLDRFCVEVAVKNSKVVKEEQCARDSGRRMINQSGVRVLNLQDIVDGDRLYVVPQGLHFVWPLVKVGNIIHPKNVASPVQGKQIRLKQLADQPRIFQVENFVTDEEIAEILSKNEKHLAPSEVGFAGWKDPTRTSLTSWDTYSEAAKIIRSRTFKILGMDEVTELADDLQVLRYEGDQWYKPHTDYFDEESYKNHDPTINNGTNRFATMFLYFSNVTEGGHTVFPLSTTHEGYDGSQIVHEGTIDTPGYIDTKEARAACKPDSPALKSPAIKGNAVLFYSQGPEGDLDPFSLHGGCPPINGIKYSANFWIWNRKSPEKSEALDAPPDEESGSNVNQMSVRFANQMKESVDFYWDPNAVDDDDEDDDDEEEEKKTKERKPLVSQGKLKPNQVLPLQTYIGHVFHVAVDDNTGSDSVEGEEEKKKRIVWTYEAKYLDNDSRVVIKY